jgi:hypothetical protein
VWILGCPRIAFLFYDTMPGLVLLLCTSYTDIYCISRLVHTHGVSYQARVSVYQLYTGTIDILYVCACSCNKLEWVFESPQSESSVYFFGHSSLCLLLKCLSYYEVSLNWLHKVSRCAAYARKRIERVCLCKMLVSRQSHCISMKKYVNPKAWVTALHGQARLDRCMRRTLGFTCTVSCTRQYSRWWNSAQTIVQSCPYSSIELHSGE